jgi:hypothetical protein
MVWVRTPLFWLTFLSAFFLAAATTTLIATSISPTVALEIWIRDDGNRNAYRASFWVILLVSGVGLGASAYMENRLSNGWEPQWLTKFLPGCVVEGFTTRNKKPLVVLRKPDQTIFELELDSNELNLAKVGDTVQVWYIGKYLAHMTALGPSNDLQIQLPIPKLSSYVKQSPMAWLILVSAPLVAGILFGKGFEHVIFREMTTSDEGQRWCYSGFEPAVWGWALCISSIMLAGWCAWKWIAGWDDSFLEQGNSNSDGF